MHLPIEPLLLILDRTARVVYANGALLSCLGTTLAAITGRDWFAHYQALHPREPFIDVMEERRPIASSVRVPIRCRSGRILDVLWYGRLIRDEGGQPKEYFAVGYPTGTDVRGAIPHTIDCASDCDEEHDE